MKRYFKICLWSPLWFPTLLLLLAAALGRRDIFFEANGWMPEWLAWAGFILMMSLFFGGVQYLITIILIWPKINFCDAASWRKWILWLPWIYTPIQLLGLLLLSVCVASVDMNFQFALFVMGCDLVLSYAYVVVWLLGYGLIRRVRQRLYRERLKDT